MNHGYHHNGQDTESAVATLIEYLMVSGVCLALLIVMLILVNNNIMENPANRVINVAFTDIGNGVSTRIVDTYSLAPSDGNITSRFDIPDEIVGKSYMVRFEGDGVNQVVTVTRGDPRLDSRISLAGIGANEKGLAGGNTTGAGINKITYDSEGGL